MAMTSYASPFNLLKSLALFGFAVDLRETSFFLDVIPANARCCPARNLRRFAYLPEGVIPTKAEIHFCLLHALLSGEISVDLVGRLKTPSSQRKLDVALARRTSEGRRPPHGYYGIEQSVIEAIIGWLQGHGG
jgi:hypothetical protein